MRADVSPLCAPTHGRPGHPRAGGGRLGLGWPRAMASVPDYPRGDRAGVPARRRIRHANAPRGPTSTPRILIEMRARGEGLASACNAPADIRE
jgi:hypothetical protein